MCPPAREQLFYQLFSSAMNAIITKHQIYTMNSDEHTRRECSAKIAGSAYDIAAMSLLELETRGIPVAPPSKDVQEANIAGLVADAERIERERVARLMAEADRAASFVPVTIKDEPLPS